MVQWCSAPVGRAHRGSAPALRCRTRSVSAPAKSHAAAQALPASLPREPGCVEGNCALLAHLLPFWGQRAPALLFSNTRAILPVCARAMTSCVVAFGPVHRHNLSRVRGVPLGKPPAGTTGAVSCGLMVAFKYLGALAPRSSRGHRASSSLAGEPEARSPLAFAMGSVTGLGPARTTPQSAMSHRAR
jgi:hypothetical protein